MENEKRVSDKQRLANSLNPLKTGEHSRNFPSKVAKFVKDPMYLSEIILKSVEKLEQSDLDPKERIAYINSLTGIHKTIFGNKFDIQSKNVNLNLETSAKKMSDLYFEILQERDQKNLIKLDSELPEDIKTNIYGTLGKIREEITREDIDKKERDKIREKKEISYENRSDAVNSRITEDLDEEYTKKREITGYNRRSQEEMAEHSRQMELERIRQEKEKEKEELRRQAKKLLDGY